jgi:hypothetical protein
MENIVAAASIAFETRWYLTAGSVHSYLHQVVIWCLCSAIAAVQGSGGAVPVLAEFFETNIITAAAAATSLVVLILYPCTFTPLLLLFIPGSLVENSRLTANGTCPCGQLLHERRLHT